MQSKRRLTSKKSIVMMSTMDSFYRNQRRRPSLITKRKIRFKTFIEKVDPDAEIDEDFRILGKNKKRAIDYNMDDPEQEEKFRSMAKSKVFNKVIQSLDIGVKKWSKKLKDQLKKRNEMLLDQYVRKERDWINRRDQIFSSGIGLKLKLLKQLKFLPTPRKDEPPALKKTIKFQEDEKPALGQSNRNVGKKQKQKGALLIPFVQKHIQPSNNSRQPKMYFQTVPELPRNISLKKSNNKSFYKKQDTIFESSFRVDHPTQPKITTRKTMATTRKVIFKKLLHSCLNCFKLRKNHTPSSAG